MHGRWRWRSRRCWRRCGCCDDRCRRGGNRCWRRDRRRRCGDGTLVRISSWAQRRSLRWHRCNRRHRLTAGGRWVADRARIRHINAGALRCPSERGTNRAGTNGPMQHVVLLVAAGRGQADHVAALGLGTQPVHVAVHRVGIDDDDISATGIGRPFPADLGVFQRIEHLADLILLSARHADRCHGQLLAHTGENSPMR